MRQQIRRGLLFFSFLLFPITIFYLSPYLIIMGAGEGIVSGSLLVFASQFVSSLIFGRAFCGWICPAGGLQEGCLAITNKKSAYKSSLIKYFLWVPWLVTIVLFFFRAGGIKKIDGFLGTTTGISVAHPYAYFIYIPMVLLLAILAITVGKRGACKTICWMAPFMVVGRKIANVVRIPSLRLKADSSLCVDCMRCEKSCPMSLSVSSMVRKENMNDSECILCGECVDSCNKAAVKFSFSRK